MYNDEIKDLLEKHYGAPKRTLIIEGDCNIIRGKRIYYYTFPYTEKTLIIRDALNETLTQGEDSSFVEVTQMYSGATNTTREKLNQCACYREYDGDWIIEFYEIVGVRYHRSFGKRIAASLILGKYPVVSLSSSEPQSFYGFWARTILQRINAKRQTTEGLSYWVNKNLFYNITFRHFAMDFFILMGNHSKTYILKDIGRTIMKYGFFLPSIRFEEIKSYHTPKEFISAIMPTADHIGINLNTLDLNMAYVIGTIASVVNRHDWKYLKNLSSDVISTSFSLNMIFDGVRIEDIISGYYQHKLRNETYYYETVHEYARDYGRMCIESSVPIRLGYSYQGLVSAHDELSRLITRRSREQDLILPLITTPSKFDFLEEQLNRFFPGEFERIRDTKRLLEEGEDQHNCVYSRRYLVRCDRAAIFHWDYAGESCTIQFAMDHQGEYYVEEIKAKYNETCLSHAFQHLRYVLHTVQAYQSYQEMPPF